GTPAPAYAKPIISSQPHRPAKPQDCFAERTAPTATAAEQRDGAASYSDTAEARPVTICRHDRGANRSLRPVSRVCQRAGAADCAHSSEALLAPANTLTGQDEISTRRRG